MGFKGLAMYRGTSLMSNNAPLGPHSALCLGTYGDPIGVGVSDERGTPVGVEIQGWKV